MLLLEGTPSGHEEPACPGQDLLRGVCHPQQTHHLPMESPLPPAFSHPRPGDARARHGMVAPRSRAPERLRHPFPRMGSLPPAGGKLLPSFMQSRGEKGSWPSREQTGKRANESCSLAPTSLFLEEMPPMWPSLLEERGSMGSCLAAGMQPSPRPPQPLTQPPLPGSLPTPRLWQQPWHSCLPWHRVLSASLHRGALGAIPCPAKAQLLVPGAGQAWDLPVTSPCARAGGDNPS